MLLFISLVIVSIVLYIYNKVMITRSEHPITQRYYNSTAKIFLGIFIGSFGVSQYLFYETRLSLFIGILFLILAVMQINHGWKASRHYKEEYLKQAET
ncbi:YtpI family protein [Salimicrobium halophilum]|uniref:YtpI-like protein n=1 Tax=Salimicrobium halophilum TaxID=86666 RepID=A0A1G8VI67_9BACI|nr:YtpI family protein [Salimicrobium halophilum]SDJ65738.1 YtpI-like protein [Salimicrobium halophilum]